MRKAKGSVRQLYGLHIVLTLKQLSSKAVDSVVSRFDPLGRYTPEIESAIHHHGIRMRTTLDVENDVLDAAKSLALGRGVSVGAALSELARRGVAARTPLSVRNGFPVFQVPDGTPRFGPDEVAAATGREDLDAARKFLEPGRQQSPSPCST